jgi:hypothetical protein
MSLLLFLDLQICVYIFEIIIRIHSTIIHHSLGDNEEEIHFFDVSYCEYDAMHKFETVL